MKRKGKRKDKKIQEKMKKRKETKEKETSFIEVGHPYSMLSCTHHGTQRGKYPQLTPNQRVERKSIKKRKV